MSCIIVEYRFGLCRCGAERRPNSGNMFIITLDGFRWQELFYGPDSALINNQQFTSKASYSKDLFWSEAPESRKEKLMPFVWNVIAQNGQILSNRKCGSKVNVKNFYSLSYPGYNEIFTGETDAFISTNKKITNRNVNLFEYLNKLREYSGKIAAFTSSNAFPYILNEERSDIYINSGYEPTIGDKLTATQKNDQCYANAPASK